MQLIIIFSFKFQRAFNYVMHIVLSKNFLTYILFIERLMDSIVNPPYKVNCL